MVKKGRILRVYDTLAVLENLESGSCIVVSSEQKDGGLKVCDRSQLSELTGTCQIIPFEAVFGFYDLLRLVLSVKIMLTLPHF